MPAKKKYTPQPDFPMFANIWPVNLAYTEVSKHS